MLVTLVTLFSHIVATLVLVVATIIGISLIAWLVYLCREPYVKERCNDAVSLYHNRILGDTRTELSKYAGAFNKLSPALGHVVTTVCATFDPAHAYHDCDPVVRWSRAYTIKNMGTNPDEAWVLTATGETLADYDRWIVGGRP